MEGRQAGAPGNTRLRTDAIASTDEERRNRDVVHPDNGGQIGTPTGR